MCTTSRSPSPTSNSCFWPTYPKLEPKAPLFQHSPNPVSQVGLSRTALHPLDGLTKLLFNTKLGGNNYITYHLVKENTDRLVALKNQEIALRATAAMTSEAVTPSVT